MRLDRVVDQQRRTEGQFPHRNRIIAAKVTVSVALTVASLVFAFAIGLLGMLIRGSAGAIVAGPCTRISTAVGTTGLPWSTDPDSEPPTCP